MPPIKKPLKNGGRFAALLSTFTFQKSSCAKSSKGDSTFAAARLAIVQGLPILAPVSIAEEIAVRLVEKQIIPATAADDAAHIALAAAHRMDFLLTWNCKHINNAVIQRRIKRECDALDVPCPVICTPMN